MRIFTFLRRCFVYQFCAAFIFFIGFYSFIVTKFLADTQENLTVNDSEKIPPKRKLDRKIARLPKNLIKNLNFKEGGLKLPEINNYWVFLIKLNFEKKKQLCNFKLLKKKLIWNYFYEILNLLNFYWIDNWNKWTKNPYRLSWFCCTGFSFAFKYWRSFTLSLKQIESFDTVF